MLNGRKIPATRSEGSPRFGLPVAIGEAVSGALA
jgi:hypothetical protein